MSLKINTEYIGSGWYKAYCDELPYVFGFSKDRNKTKDRFLYAFSCYCVDHCLN